jgi:hypothetical protein
MSSILRAAARTASLQLRRRPRPVGSLCLWGALVAASCGDNSAWSVSSSTGGDPAGSLVVVQSSSGVLPAFFAQMVSAPYTTAFFGERRVVLHRDAGVFDYVEAVGADGHGRTAIEVRQLYRHPPELDPTYAQMLLTQRGRFGYRVRDPQVTDLALFALNWEVTVLARDTLIAGQSCWRLDVRRAAPLSNDDSVYELAVEPVTGLVLAWRETDFGGNVRSEVEFLTFELGADVSTMDLRERDFGVVVLDGALDLSTQVGAAVHEPELCPPGFEREVIELLTVPVTAPPPSGNTGGTTADEWVKFAYTDGFERVFFMHLVDRAVSLPAPSTSKIVHFPFGSWTFAVGPVNGSSVIAAGKVPPQYLAELIQSAMQ